MKSINQFDYPSKQAQNYKNYSQNDMSDTKDKTTYNKTRYKQNLQYHMEIQRSKVKQTEKIKKDQQAKKNKSRIQQQLQKKKKQLQNLQLLKIQAQQNQRKSYELALLKQQQDKIRKQQEYRKKQQFDENAVNRFGEAMKRLYQQREQNSFKQRLAQQRRKTADEFQRIQRIRANKYKSQIEQKQKVEPKQMTAEQYKRSLANSGISKLTDYNKSCLHNLKIIPQKTKDQQKQNAFEKGKLQRDQVQEKSLQRKRRHQQNVRRSKQRGKQAWQKIQRQRQYSSFEKQTEEQQKKYNLDRIQAGKKNQFIGLKPTTLSQMQINKKQRSEQQFDKMFFQRPYNQTQNFNKTASKFQIVDPRMPQRKQNSFQQPKTQNNKTKSYFKQRQQSEIPCVSQGKYSFQQPEYSDFRNQSKSHSNIQQHEQQYEQQNEQQQTGYNVKNAWKQTGIPNQKYSSSPQQQRKPVNPFNSSGTNQQTRKHKQQNQTKKPQAKKGKNQNKLPKGGNKQQASDRQSFNTDDMLKKYGLKRDSPQTKKVQTSSKTKNQNKRKVVQLANICQKKQHQKQQLNYSSQSQEDSNV